MSGRFYKCRATGGRHLHLLIALVFSGLVYGQEVSQIERNLQQKVPQYSMKSNTFLQALLNIASRFQLPLGIEWIKTRDALRPVELDWRDATVRQILADVVHTQNRYSLQVHENVIHVFDRDLVADPRNFLNLKLDRFGPMTGPMRVITAALFHDVRRIARPLPGPPLQGIPGSGPGYDAEPQFRFDEKNISIRDILNRLVTLAEFRIWIVSFAAGDQLTRSGYLDVLSVSNPDFVPPESQPFWVLLRWGDEALPAMIADQ